MRTKLLALSFDDGPDVATPEILDVLGEFEVRATFFVLGRQIRDREDILVRMRDEGHELGNHAFNHVSLAESSDALIESELAETSTAIERVTGVRPRLVRPPYGSGAERVAPLARRLGMEVVLWTNMPVDWDGSDAEAISWRMLQQTVSDDVVVLHDGADGGGDRQPTVDALRAALPEWLSSGYRIVTISELLRVRPWSARRRVVVDSRFRKAIRAGSNTLRLAVRSS